MKKYSFVSILAALCLVAACTDQPDIVIRPGQEMVLTARTEQPASKTVVTNETHVYWEPGDEIAIFSGDKSGKFTTDLSAASATATFKGSLGGDPDETLWAVYPYSDKATFDGESITTVLPSVQTARAGSFGKDMNLAVAQTTGSTLQFYNVGGGVRFSVKEEGIKKVMFEGLNGEILAGTVKVGFENGLPVVKEVTSGSQFLTLLPPEGETFQKDTWYYIVALPAALEKGYKLRFYKTDDYARRLSETAVTISRSIYGSVAGADEGLAYESIVTKFPETEEEWEESYVLTNNVGEQVCSLIDEFKSSDDAINTEQLINCISNIEGIESTYPIGDNEGFVMVLNNGIHINAIYDEMDVLEDNLSSSFSSISTKTNNGIISPQTGNKKAALINPFTTVDAFNLGTTLQFLGFDLDWFPGPKANLQVFSPKSLCQYDLIFIVTHGSSKTNIRDQKGDRLETSLRTGQKVGSLDISNEENLSLAAFLTDNGVYYAVTPNWLKKYEELSSYRAAFQRSIVFALACKSLVNEDFADYFTDRGASVYVGDKYRINEEDAAIAVDGIIKYLSMGVSVKNTTKMIRKDFSFIGQILYPIDLSKEPYGTAYLINPTPINLSVSLNNSVATLAWDQPIIKGTVQYKVHLYDALLNEKVIDCQTIRYTTEPLKPGEYTWRVEANILYEGEIIESFISGEDHFTVKEDTYETPSLIDLGMPSGVKWASFNLGATKPEESGRYFAWGETTPKNQYDWSTYKWCKGSETSITKYCWISSYGYNGFVDNKRQLDLSDDAANAQLKGEFRTPTCDDWKELLEHTTHQWTNNYNGTGVAGLVCKSTVSGYTSRQIFIPAAGYEWSPYTRVGNYMTASAICSDPSGFDVVYFTENELYGASYDNKVSAGYRFEGHTIRPVYGQPVAPSVVHSVTVSPTSYNFGSVVAGQQSDSKKFSITNDGSEDIEYWVESCPDGFAYPDGMKNKVRGKVSANSTLERFWVRFKPTQAKNYSGTVVLGTTDPEYPYLYISVSGKGTN